MRSPYLRTHPQKLQRRASVLSRTRPASIGCCGTNKPVGYGGLNSFVVKANFLFETHKGDASKVITKLNELTKGAIEHTLIVPEGRHLYSILVKVEAYDAAEKADAGLTAWTELTDAMSNEDEDECLSLILSGYHLDKIDVLNMTREGSLQSAELQEYALSKRSSTVYAGIIEKTGLEANIKALQANLAKTFHQADLVNFDVDMESIAQHK